jgi:putative oxidoreductase
LADRPAFRWAIHFENQESVMKNSSWGLTILRVIVGIVFLVHGGQKLFINGFGGVAGYLGHVGIPFPAFFAVGVSLVEFLGGAALLLGLATRWAALALAVDMLVAVLMVKLKGGFFAPAGVEYELTLVAACVCLALAGPGAASVESVFARRSLIGLR